MQAKTMNNLNWIWVRQSRRKVEHNPGLCTRHLLDSPYKPGQKRIIPGFRYTSNPTTTSFQHMHPQDLQTQHAYNSKRKPHLTCQHMSRTQQTHNQHSIRMRWWQQFGRWSVKHDLVKRKSSTSDGNHRSSMIWSNGKNRCSQHERSPLNKEWKRDKTATPKQARVKRMCHKPDTRQTANHFANGLITKGWPVVSQARFGQAEK